MDSIWCPTLGIKKYPKMEMHLMLITQLVLTKRLVDLLLVPGCMVQTLIAILVRGKISEKPVYLLG